MKKASSSDQSWRVRDNVLTNRKRLDLKSIPLTTIPSIFESEPEDSDESISESIFDKIEYWEKCCLENTLVVTQSVTSRYEYKNSRRVSEIETPYKPKLVSIGPFHHKSPHLQPMEEHKLRIRNNCSTSEETLAKAMRYFLVQTRDFYSENFKDEIDSGAFVDMMILDGCFVIELLRLYETIPKGTVNDNHYFPAPFSLPKLQCDLLMLENQLPMFVLQTLFDITRKENEKLSLAHLALKFFDPLLQRGENFVTKLEVGGQHHHLLSLFHFSFLPSHSVLTITPDERSQSRHSAKKLTDAGIALAKSENRSLLDIEFNGGVLKIPTLRLCSGTHLVLRNLLDYESIALRYQEDVPRLFSNLCSEIDYDFDKSYLCDQLSKLNQYYNQKRHGWKAECVRDYCSTPWKFLSLVTVILLLVLAFVQTVFTVLAYFRPPS